MAESVDATGGLDADTATLVARDPTMAAIVARAGPPPSFRRPWSLRTIVLVVLEQQLSLDAATAHLAATLGKENRSGK